ncbi:hypothetical protein AAIH70_28270 [Neorhizobium sp. BT27B]|uniref:hypothetical protein n=1 Tax=Neorhizobium sp. BT27B TaxID=3142625 RepID=UPI003D2A3C5A
MIGAFAKLLGVDAWLVKAGAALLVGLSLMAGAWWVHGRIYDDGYQTASAKYEAQIAADALQRAEASLNEQRRQAIANNAAKRREAEAIATLEAQEAENLELRRRLASEAQQDPDAGRPSLGAGSVQRINQVR